MELILPSNSCIDKFLQELVLYKFFTPTTMEYIKAFIMAFIASWGCPGKLKDISAFSSKHRTSFGHFLSKGIWDDSILDSLIKRVSTNQVFDKALRTNEPVFISIDDTICEKKKPSSQANSPTEQVESHFSHLDHRHVYGHQAVAALVSSGDLVLNYDIHLYEKEKESKIQYTKALADKVPIPPVKSYFLCDSWYTCPEVIEAFELRGYNTIAAIKTNRIFYPEGIRISISDFASKYLQKSDADLVTVCNKQYYVYRYEGKLNGIENAVVLLSYPKECFGTSNALKAFLCTDVSLSTATILEYYHNRWPIEVFFKAEKNHFGFDKYQFRKVKALKRFWLLTSFAHMFCTIGVPKNNNFFAGYRIIQNSVKIDYIQMIYECGQKNIDFCLVAKLLG